MADDRQGGISKAELRRVLFDDAILGFYAARPLILARAGLAGAVMTLEDAGEMGEAARLRNSIDVASRKAAALRVDGGGLDRGL